MLKSNLDGGSFSRKRSDLLPVCENIRSISYYLDNSSDSKSSIGDTPEIREEIRKLNKDINDELRKALGTPYDSDVYAGDEDSVYYDYKVDDHILVRAGSRDFTEPGGNDLLDVELAFADHEYLLPW